MKLFRYEFVNDADANAKKRIIFVHAQTEDQSMKLCFTSAKYNVWTGTGYRLFKLTEVQEMVIPREEE